MTKLRVLDSAYKELIALDPKTAVSKNFIRQLALTGKIITVRAGRRRLISMDSLLLYLENPSLEKTEESKMGIRKVPERL